MATPPELTQLAFAAGVDESQQAEVLDPLAGFTTVENIRQPSRGVARKRYGFATLSLGLFDGTSRSAGYRHFAHGKQTCVVTGHVLDVYSPTAGASLSRDRVPECMARRYGVSGAAQSSLASNAIVLLGVEYCNGYYVLAWIQYETGGGAYQLYAQVIDAANRSIVSGPTLLSASPRSEAMYVVSYGTVAFVLYGSALSTITEKHIDLSSASAINTGWSGATNLATDWDTAGGAEWHACSLGSGATKCALGYGRAADGALKTFSTAGVLQTQAIAGGSSGCYVGGTQADVIWVAYGAGLVRGQRGSSITTTDCAAGTVDGSMLVSEVKLPISTGTKTGLLVSGGRWRRFDGTSGTVVASGTAQAPGGSIVGGPFSVDGRHYAAFTTGFQRTDTFVVADISEESVTRRPVANVAPRLVQNPGQTWAQNAAIVSSTKVAYAVATLKAATVVGIDLVELDFADSARWLPVRYGSLTVMPGGVVTYFDGTRVAEVSFMDRPGKPTLALVAAGSITKTSVRYVAAYEQPDAQGNWHISGVSDPSATTSPAAENVDVTVAAFPCTSRHDASNNVSQARLVLFRQNITGGPYYRVNGSERSIYNQTSLTIRDSTNDVSAAQKLYTQPGTVGTALNRYAPPAMTCLAEYNGMLVGVADDQITLWYSGQPVPGEGPWFNDVFQVPIPDGGEITALAAQDGALFVFKRRNIFAVAGEPPSDNGAAGGLGTPRKLAVDVGAVGPHTCVTALGTFFVSDRGIELLTRAQSVEWIGEQVQSTFAAFPYVRSMTLDAAQSLVYIECASAESGGLATTAGRTLVFDLSLKTWSTDRRKNQAGTADTPAQSGAMVWSGSAWRYSWLGAEGRVYVEDQTTHLDPNGAWVTMRVETAWFKRGGIQGQQMENQLLLLARRYTRADLSVYVAYDYSTTYESPIARTADNLDTLSTALGRLQVFNQLHDTADGQAMRIKIEDATPTGGTVSTGQGADWIALTLEGHTKPGAALLPESAG